MKTYNEIKEIVEKSKNDISEFDAASPEIAKSYIIYQITEKYGILNTKVLENLTGLTFNTNENLYNYFKINLKIDNISEWSFCIIKDILNDFS